MFSRSAPKEKKADLILNKFYVIAFSLFLSRIIFIIGGTVDNIFSGQFLSVNDLNAIQLVSPIIELTSFVGCVIGQGFSSIYNQIIGKEGKDKANKVAGMGIITAAIVGIVYALILLAIKNPIINMYKVSDDIKALAEKYYYFQIGVAVIHPVNYFLIKFVTLEAHAKISVTADVCNIAVKILSSALLIMPLGIMGLGLGSLLAMITSSLVLSTHWLTKRCTIKFKPYFSPSYLWRATKKGVAMKSDHLFNSVVGSILVVYITNTFGTAFLVVNPIISLALSTATSLLFCIPDGCASMLGLAYGSNNNDDIKKCFKIQAKYGVIFSLALTTVFCSLCMFIPYMYGIKNDNPMYQIAYLIPLIMSPSFIFYMALSIIKKDSSELNEGFTTILISLLSDLIFHCSLPILLSLGGNQILYIVGFFLTPIASLMIVLIYLFIKNKGIKIYKFRDFNEKQFSFDMFLTAKDVDKNRPELKKEMVDYGLSESTIKKCLSIIQDFGRATVKNNPNKTVTERVTFCLGKDKMRIIAKHDGRTLTKAELEKEVADKSHLNFQTYCRDIEGDVTNAVSLTYATATIKY